MITSRFFLSLGSLPVLSFILLGAGCEKPEPVESSTPVVASSLTPAATSSVIATSDTAAAATPEVAHVDSPAMAPLTPIVAVEHAAERPVKRGDKLTTEQMTLLAGKPGVVKLTWRTESEKSNFGFNVMRSTQKEEPMEPVNKLVILGAGDSSTPNVYEFYDTSVKIGEVFYYQVESISMQGQTEKMSPVLSFTVNREFLGYEDEPAGVTSDTLTTSSSAAQ